MSLSLSNPSAPRCISCCRRVFRMGILSSTWTQPSLIQVRGKKKNPKARQTIPVRLAQDLVGFGRKGSIIAVPIGQMRNYYYPKHIMDYLPPAERREIERSNMIIQRDVSFGKESVKPTPAQSGARIMSEIRPTNVNLDLLSPEATFTSLSDIIPPSILFYRTPIRQHEPTRREKAAQKKTEPVALSTIATKDIKDIYGSVSTADVAANIKALIENTDAAGRVVINQEDIRFLSGVEASEEIGRVKTLGVYDIEIKIKGHDETVKRRLTVLAEGDESPEPLQSVDAAVMQPAPDAKLDAAQEDLAGRAGAARGEPLPDREAAAQEPIRPSNISP